MSKGSKKQFKQYPISSVEEGMKILSSLIVNTVINLEALKKYAEEAEELMSKYSDDDTIPASEYDGIHDKVLFRQRELLKYISDHQSDSFSYISLRRTLVSKKYLKRNLTKEMNDLLQELLDIRNWSFHNVQSRMNADLEIAKRQIPAELNGMVKIIPQLNPIFIPRVNSYAYEMLYTFCMHNDVRIRQFDSVLNEMKEDYQNMFSSLPNQPFLLTPNGFSNDIQYVDKFIDGVTIDQGGYGVTNLSMGIQKGKYDGSDEKFQQFTKL